MIPSPPPIWATPTLIPLPTPGGTPVLDMSQVGYSMAENLVQGYQQANAMGALDILFFVLLLMLIIGGLWSIMRHLQRL